MKRSSWIACLLMVLVPAGLVEASEEALLKNVAVKLEPVLEKLSPKAEVTYPPGSASLVIGYRTQKFKIHGRSMTGEISKEAHDEVGPSFKGFVLKVRLQERGEINQGITPQTLKGPYWQTDIDVTPLKGSGKQAFWGLSYGSRMDPKLLDQIRKVLKGLEGEDAA